LIESDDLLKQNVGQKHKVFFNQRCQETRIGKEKYVHTGQHDRSEQPTIVEIIKLIVV
jgi:hypothetical protein